MNLTHWLDAAAMTALWTHVWQSTLYAGGAWLGTVLLRHYPARVRFAVWVSASLKFLIPIALLTGLGAHWARHAAVAQTPKRAVFYTFIEEISRPFGKGALPDAGVATQVHPDFLHAWGPSLLVALWLCGFLVMATRWMLQWNRARALVRDAQLLEEGRETAALSLARSDAGLRTQIDLVLTCIPVEPGVFGVFRSVLVWPEGLSDRLDAPQLAAIVAHEVEHVRRRDNLMAAVHACVQALFWFHPAVYWIGSKLTEERERACDERVIGLEAAPEKYAESILKVCAFCLEAPLACIAGVSGSDLKMRVLRIMSRRSGVALTVGRRVMLASAALLIFLLPLGFGVVRGQGAPAGDAHEIDPATARDLPKFDAASIKPANPNEERHMLMFTPDGIAIHGMPTQMLLQTAFGVEADRIVGAPSWAKSNHYDIEAKVAPEDGPKVDKLKVEDRRAMLIPLLVERFHLKYHYEKRQLPLYALVVANGGPKLQAAKVDPAAAHAPSPLGGAPPKGIDTQGRTMMAPGEIESQNTTLEMLTHALAGQLGRSVVDKTGLTGRYDYTLKWTPENAPPPMMKHEGGFAGPESPTDAPEVSLFTAIQEQLGLKLESQKGDVDVIVIDHLDLPSAN